MGLVGRTMKRRQDETMNATLYTVWVKQRLPEGDVVDGWINAEGELNNRFEATGFNLEEALKVVASCNEPVNVELLEAKIEEVAY